MALGTILGAIAAPLISGAVTSGASKLFGGGGTSVPFNPVSIDAGGLSTAIGKGKDKRVSVTSSPFRQGLVGNVAATFPEQAKLIRDQRAILASGVSGLRASRLAEIENARRKAVGDLRENLSRRRVLGSSFAQDALTRANVQFAQEADKVAAESFLQEMEISNQLIQQEFQARRGEFTTFLDELNIQANLAAELASGATSQLGANARLKASLDAEAAAGAGEFFGSTIYPAVNKAITGAFSRAA